jgi:hypothetical protein
MADNVTADPGAGGATFATDDIAGVHYPIEKLAWGALDTATLVASGAGAIPIQDGGNSITVDGPLTDAQLRATAVPVSGTVTGQQDSNTIQANGARTPQFAIIDAATSGDNTLVAAQGAGVKIRVLALFAVASGAVNVRFESGAAGTALTGQMNLVANTGFVLPFNPAGWFETGANVLLNMELSAAISVDGSLVWIPVS